MITGIHALLFSKEADEVRAFFRDVLGFESVDAGGGWLIFALPPAELGIHPTDGSPRQELYLMCDDIQQTVDELTAKGVEFPKPICIADTGALQQLRRLQSARGEYHLPAGSVFDRCATSMPGYADRPLAFEEHPVDDHAGLDPQIAP